MRGAFPGDRAPGHDPIGHLELAANCDAYLVAPASANTIAKLAAGHRRLDAHHLLPRLRGAAPGRAGDERPHVRRRGHPGQPGDPARARRRGDRARARARSPRAASTARAACPTPSRLLAAVEAALPAGERPWDGLRVLVTAGGTREPIDPVRFIGNRSSGRMGIALAAAAARRGAEVTLIAANVALPEPRRRPPHRRRDRRASSPPPPRAEFPTAHVLLMAAAPADFRAGRRRRRAS